VIQQAGFEIVRIAFFHRYLRKAVRFTQSTIDCHLSSPVLYRTIPRVEHFLEGNSSEIEALMSQS
jgi:hypothetical protein